MSYQIRAFTDADYPALARVLSVCFEENISVEGIRWEDRMTDERCKQGRWVAEVGGEVVGFGQYSQPVTFYHPQKFEVNVVVLPEHRRQGIGSALCRQVAEALAPFNPISLGAGAYEHWTDSLRFLAARGYTEKMRNWESHLDVQGFDPALWQGLVAEAAAKGYEIRAYSDLADDPERAQKLYGLVTEVRRDVPTTEPWQEVSYETWAKIFENPHFYPEGYFIAMKDGEWIGVSALWRSDDEGVLTTGLTAVKRAHRGTGIAKALKLRAIDKARSDGYRTIKTWNESNNQRMLAINMKLGFVRKPAWIMFQKQLGQ